jgi:hypothetical protein
MPSSSSLVFTQRILSSQRLAYRCSDVAGGNRQYHARPKRSLPATKGDLRDLETVELLEIAARGEDSPHQFKADFTNAASMAAEIVALANSSGRRHCFDGARRNQQPTP